MAYCLRSFVETLDQVLHPDMYHKKWVLDQDHRPHIQSLFENVTFLQDFLDKSSPLIQERISSYEDQIMEMAQKAADILETYITDQILLNPEGQSFTIVPPNMEEVIRVFEDAKQEVIKMADASQQLDYIYAPPVSSTRYPESKLVVGLEKDLNQLRSRLTSARKTELDVIPIVGMGGMGKTTLARILYDEFSSKSHFDRCAWVTVSQTYEPQQILKTLLACVTKEDTSEKMTSDLVTTLYKELVGRRYLIVLDDIWSHKAWDDVQRAFAREYKGSRIIFTTRENSMVDYVKSNSHEMRLINMDKSWELLRGKVFGEESCPLEFEEIGKRIALNCGGLPLALQVIGGLLATSQRSKGFWEYVAHNVSSLVTQTDDQFAGIFSWSFTHLPHYLKPCFLYMGAFPEDYEIPASRVINLWVAEGFLYPLPNKSLEEAAKTHLKALVDRNLIFVRRRSLSGKAKSYGIHDLLRDLCLRKAEEKKFVCVKDSSTNIPQDDTLGLRRVSIYKTNNAEGVHYGSWKLKSFARSFLHRGDDRKYEFSNRLCYESSLLRVLDVKNAGRCDFGPEFLQLVNLRYISFSTPLSPIAEIEGLSVLTNLQTLILEGSLTSLAILDHLPQLRNLQVVFIHKIGTLSLEHENLQRLSRVQLKHLIHLEGKIPNLRNLRIAEEVIKKHGVVVDLTYFQKLESLSLSSIEGDFSFPSSLKKLKLFNCIISQTLVTGIGILPGLESLVIDDCDLDNETWEPAEGEYRQLRVLRIYESNLVKLIANELNFPVLQHLVIDYCDNISEISNDIGGIETLETITMFHCTEPVYESARTILREQRTFGNTLLQLKIDGVLVDDQD